MELGAPDLRPRDLTAFKEALAALGWKEGANVVIEARWAQGRRDRLLSSIDELIVKNPAVIVTNPLSVTIASAKAAPSVPVVQLLGGSPVEARLAASLARPGGMVTGLTNLAGELIEKRTELLADTMPRMQRIGYLLDSSLKNRRGEFIESARRAANRLNKQAIIAEAGRAEELEPAFAQFRKSAVEGIVMLPATYLAAETPRIMQLALSNRLPAIGTRAEAAEMGGLLSYGNDPIYNARRAAWYVDRTLKGTKPGDLPIEEPSKFELVVNLKTAKALGITIPPVVMVRADRVIE